MKGAGQSSRRGLATVWLEIHTGDKVGAGTRAEVQVRLTGERGNSEQQVIRPKGLVFRRNTVETFQVDDGDVGKLSAIDVGHDDTQLDAGWYLERCVVRTKDADQPSEFTYFPCGAWLGHDDATGVAGGPLNMVIKSTEELPEMQKVRTMTRAQEQPLGLRMERASIPHPAKDRGEDAYFLCNGDSICSLGVSDGVGEWARDGIDSGAFARALMKGAQQEAVVAEEACVTTLLQKGMDLVNMRAVQGSATACILALDRERGVLHSINLGDSGYLIVRNGEAIYHSPQQEHFFGCPFQLQVGGKDTPQDAQLFSHVAEVGDVIVVGTDGLFDNLHDHEIANCIHYSAQKRARDASAVKDLANDLMDLAFEAASTRGRKTPYAKAASEEFDMIYTGGKKDDITVVVAEIVEI